MARPGMARRGLGKSRRGIIIIIKGTSRMLIKIADINISGGTQPREEIKTWASMARANR